MAVSQIEQQFIINYKKTLSQDELTKFENFTPDQQINSILNKMGYDPQKLTSEQRNSLFTNGQIATDTITGLSVEGLSVQQRDKIKDADGKDAFASTLVNNDGTISTIIYAEDGTTIKRRIKTKKDSNGQDIELEKTIYNEDGTRTFTQFDEQNNQKIIATYDKLGKPSTIIKTQKDENGQDKKIEETVYNEDSSKVVTQYDENENEKSLAEYSQDGKLLKRTESNFDGTKNVIEYNSDGKTGKLTVYDQDGVTISTLNGNIDEQGGFQKDENTDWVVQVGDTPIKLVRKSLTAQGITNPTDDELKKAMAEFLSTNKGKVFKNSKGIVYLLAGQTVKIKGQLDTSQNKTKEGVEVEYNQKIEKQQQISQEQKNAAELKRRGEAKKELDALDKKSATKKQQGQIIAKKLYSDMNGLGTKSTLKTDLQKINQDNVVDTVDEFKRMGMHRF